MRCCPEPPALPHGRPVGLRGGRDDPHHLESQFLPGGPAHPFLWEPPAYSGSGHPQTLHDLCESWGWYLRGAVGCGLQALEKPRVAFPLSSPLRRTVGMTVSARTTLASPLTPLGELPPPETCPGLLAPLLGPRATVWLSLPSPSCAQKPDIPGPGDPTSPLWVSSPDHF